jgi:uncharacterized protein (DUF2384 family)
LGASTWRLLTNYSSLIVAWNQRQTTTEILTVTASASFKITRIEEEQVSLYFLEEEAIKWFFIPFKFHKAF